MWFDWLYWWAGKRWGKRAIDVFLGNHPKAVQRTARLERLLERFGWLAIVIVYFQPVPNALVFAGAGLTGMRLRTFLMLDLIRKLLWIAFCVGLGYAIGQSAVDVAKGVVALRALLHDRADRADLRAPVLEIRAVPGPANLGGVRSRPLAALIRYGPEIDS